MTDTPVDGKVQRVQAMLYAKASNEPETRFKRLYKYLIKPEWVESAISRVLRSRGSRTAGIDGKTRNAYLDEKERAALAESILDELRGQTYQSRPARRAHNPKPGGGRRPVNIFTIRDRVVQEMARMVIEPVFEATFLPCSYGFRPNRCTWDALAEAYQFLLAHCRYYLVIKTDIQNCFGTINRSVLMRQLRRRILDKRLLALLWEMLQAGVLSDLQYAGMTVGAPQGSRLSPLLSNVYMHPLDEWMYHRFHAISSYRRSVRQRKGELAYVRYIRYADDIAVMLREGQDTEGLKRELTDFVRQELKMSLSEEKTTVVHARQGFDFLGVRTFVAPPRSNPSKMLPYQEPSKKSVAAYRQKVRELTHPNLDYVSPGERIRALNWLILGWASYHRWGNAKETFSKLSSWTIKKVHRMLRRYTPGGKRATYQMYFRPVSECTNLRRWKRFTRWLTPSVKIDERLRLGLLPMAVISTAGYWQYRGTRIPPAYRLLGDETGWNERDTDFHTDTQIIENVQVGPASCKNSGKYNLAYWYNRKVALWRDRYTCAICGYKSQRQKGDVNDLEVHHVDPNGDNSIGNLQTVCLDCHRRLTATPTG